MNIKLTIPDSISENVLIAPNGDSWQRATASDIWFGVVQSPLDGRWPIDGDDQNSNAQVCFSGICLARAAENIPDSGGPIEVVNGEVRVGTAASIGFILPLAEGQPSRVAGDLVDIIIR